MILGLHPPVTVGIVTAGIVSSQESVISFGIEVKDKETGRVSFFSMMKPPPFLGL